MSVSDEGSALGAGDGVSHGFSSALYIAALSLLYAVTAEALDFRSVAVPAAVLYDAPSAKARKLFILTQGYPIEILVTLEAWLKVRDASGELAWIETRSLSMQRMVMVKVWKPPPMPP